MPKPDKRNYCVFAMFMIPVANVEDGLHTKIMDIPAGAPMVTEIVEQSDLYTDDDWEDFGHTVMTAFARRLRSAGWPALDPDIPTSVVKDVQAETIGTEAQPRPDKPTDDTCWSCHAPHVETARGSICPNGCETYESTFAHPLSVGMRNAAATEDAPDEQAPSLVYEETKESPRPTRMPTGPIQEPTD